MQPELSKELPQKDTGPVPSSDPDRVHSVLVRNMSPVSQLTLHCSHMPHAHRACMDLARRCTL